MANVGLKASDLSVSRGAGDVLKRVEIHAKPGELTVLLGPNGAGKTTLLDAISGLVRPREGRLRLDGINLEGLGRRKRSRLGVRHVEQGRTVFPDLTVAENLAVAAPARFHDEVLELFPELVDRLSARAGVLSGGEQQMLVLARALLRPESRHSRAATRLLLIDEMSLGLAPVVVTRLLPVVRSIADRGVSVLLVEQFVHLVLPIADSAYVLDRGRITFSGSADELANKPEMLHDAYLSGAADSAGF